MPTFRSICALPVIAALFVAPATQAGQVRVAVAANFTATMKEVAADFESHTGDKVLLSFGSTGSLYAQIRHGAPYDLFLAADVRRPRALEKAGLTVPGSRFTYAVGRLALWSRRPGMVDAHGAVLKHGKFARLAIANPTTAPYGAAARQVLEHLKLWDALKLRIVRGENIAQAHQFVATGNAELGFVAFSQVAQRSGGSRWVVPQSLYSPIRQQAVLLARGKDNRIAHALVAYLKGKAARAVIRRFGYATE